MSVFQVFLDAEFKYVSRISLLHTHLLYVERLESSAPGHLCVFTVGAMKNSRISSPRKMVLCFCNDVFVRYGSSWS